MHGKLEARELTIASGLTGLPRRERRRLSLAGTPNTLDNLLGFHSSLAPTYRDCNSFGSVTFRHIMCL